MKEFRYFRIIWDKRDIRPGRWLAVDCFSSSSMFFWYITITVGNICSCLART